MISEHNANSCFLRPSVTTELEMRDQLGRIFLEEYLLAEHKFVLRFALTKGAKLFQISVSLRLP